MFSVCVVSKRTLNYKFGFIPLLVQNITILIFILKMTYILKNEDLIPYSFLGCAVYEKGIGVVSLGYGLVLGWF